MTTNSRPVNAVALVRYRIAAFATGVMLLGGTTMIILEYVASVPHMEPETRLVWLFHGYFFSAYVILTYLLGVKLSWPLKKHAVVMIAGTIPTLSFVAEHYVAREARSHEVRRAAA